MDGRRLSDQEYETASQWIAEKAGDLICPVCAHEDWAMGDLMARFYSKMPAGVSYPVVVCVCTHCAYVLAFSAIAIGIEARNPPDGEEADNG